MKTDTLQDAGYAVVGAAVVAAETARAAAIEATRLPRHIDSLAATAPGRVAGAYDDLTRKGREVVGTVRRDPQVRRAKGKAKAADREVREAVSSTRDAGRAQAAAARSAARDVRAASYRDMTVEELQQLAAQRDIGGRSNMKKSELVRALSRS